MVPNKDLNFTDGLSSRFSKEAEVTYYNIGHKLEMRIETKDNNITIKGSIENNFVILTSLFYHVTGYLLVSY